MTDIKGYVVLITGASSGIGEGVCRRMAEAGCKVVAVARSEDKLKKLCEEMGNESGYHLADLRSRAAVQEMEKEVVAKFGVPDAIINCAGCMYFTLMKNQFFDDWENMIDINCKGLVNCCGVFLPAMMKRGKGHIVNISSDAALQVFPALTVYNASKAFVHSFTMGLRAECVGTGVRVTEILPGDVRTNLVMTNRDKEAAEKTGVAINELVGGDADNFNPNGLLLPVDIANAIHYALTSPSHVGVHQIVIEPVDQMWGDATALDIKA